MKIVRAVVVPFRLPLRAPLASAHGPITERRGVLLRLDTAEGRSGFGEATPLPGFGLEPVAAARDALAKLAALALGRGPCALDAILDEAERLAPDRPAARAALDVALHDLAAQAEGLPLAAWLARRTPGAARARTSVAVNALVGAASAQDAADEAARAVADGFRALKLKVGAAPLDEDERRVAAVRAATGPEIALRLDANAAWSVRQAVASLRRLAACAPEWVEQPVASDDMTGLRTVRSRTGLRIAADESATTPESVDRVLAADAADVIVVKPAAAGGLRAALRLAGRARSRGALVAVTTLLDGAIGRAASRALAAALPPPLPACGLATAALLAVDLAEPERPSGGALAVAGAPGLGVRPDEARLAAVAEGGALTLCAPPR